jgi:peptidyl-prolyl cis-trans isomerase D
MLTAIRDRVSGWIAYFIVLLISIPFALWGVDQYFGGGDPLIAAEVNGVEIPVEAFNYQFQQQRRYLQQLAGGQLPSGQDDAAIKQNVIEGMVRAEVLQQEAQAAGYRISDQAVLDELTGLEVFQTAGRFDPRRYAQLLQAQGQTRAGFEQNLRRQLGLSYFEEGISQSAFLPPSAQQELRRLQDQRRRFAYFVIPASSADVEISDQAIREYYRSHQTRFQTPERVQLAYVELSEQALADQIKPKTAALRQYYRDHADEYTTPEQRKLRHILLKVPEGADQAAIEATRRRAEELAARLQAGEIEFAAAAKEHSEDELSASAGGDLGFVARGDLNPSVEDVLFELGKGEISEPVRTELGFQIIQLTDVKPAVQQAFSEVREEVARDYRRSESQERFAAAAEQLEALSYEQSGSLEPAAEALDLAVQETGWLTRSQGEGIAANPAIRRAAFQTEVLQGGHNSDIVELGPGRIAVLRVVEHETARSKPLNLVREDIRQILAAQKARDQAAEMGEQALAALRSGETLSAVAEKYQTSVKQPGFVVRGGDKAPAPVVAEVFRLAKPRSGKPSFGGVPLPAGYAVIALREVQPGNAEQDASAQIATLGSDEPSASYGAREREAAYEALESTAEIEINRGNL